MKKRLFHVTAVAAGFAAAASAQIGQNGVWETFPDTWVAVDELGRPVADSDKGVDRDMPDPETSVGVFYYLWHYMHNTYDEKDVASIVAENPTDPQWGPEGAFHWGSTPWIGKYRGGDPYAVSKHLQMLSDAGVDFLFLDCTNAVYYPNQVKALFAEIDRRESLGLRWPKLCFMLHSNQNQTLKGIYKTFFTDTPQYDKYWYVYDGKPLIFADRKEVEKESGEDSILAEILDRFTFRNSWAWMEGKNPEEWSWLEYYPQKPGFVYEWSDRFHQNIKRKEQISVSVAQHATTKVGKSYHNGRQPDINIYGKCKETPYGYYFQEQWDQAIKQHVPVVMVTQFNEWVAQRFVIKNQGEYGNVRPGATPGIGESYFVDVYNPEFSRDLEPSRAKEVRDNYYLQLVSNIRKYRGVNRIPEPTASLTIDIDGPFSQWDAESLEFRDDKGDTKYTSANAQRAETMRRPSNDIIRSKMTKDKDCYYLMVETLDAISDPESSDLWMRLLLNTDCDYESGWWGYDFMVYKNSETGKYSLMRHEGGKDDFVWVSGEPVAYRIEGNMMQLSMPRHLIDKGEDIDIDFKWADNFSGDNPDIMSFISDGDAAPNGRFNYRYKGSRLKTAGIGCISEPSDGIDYRIEDNTVSFFSSDGAARKADVYDSLGRCVARESQTVSLDSGIYFASTYGSKANLKFIIR